MGLNDFLTGSNSGLAAEASAANADVVRFGVQDGDWERSDIQMQAAQEAGLNSMVVIRPRTAGAGQCADFARQVASRYPTAILEMWNEPNLELGYVPPRQVGRCYRAAADAVAPRRLLAPALAPFSDAPKYLEKMLAVTGKHVPLAIHPYPNAAVPAVYMEEVRGWIDSVQRLRGWKNLWVTEIGVSSGPGFLTEERQARTLRRIVRLLERERVRSIVVHRIIDTPTHENGGTDRGVNQWEGGNGILRTDRTRKPAFYAIAKAFS
jgi:hypothetical protein